MTTASVLHSVNSSTRCVMIAISDSDRKLHGQRVAILDREIDSLVYGLYGLTDEEIEIVVRSG